MLEFIAKALGAVVAFCGLAILIGLIMAVPVMLLWDYVMPYVFGLPEITIGRALALVLLCYILFGSKSSSSK
jgi:hypothetical protein